MDLSLNGVTYQNVNDLRWAYFFFQLGVEQQYLPKKFRVGGTIFQPTFLATKGEFSNWVHTEVTEPTEDKVRILMSVAKGTGTPIVWFSGPFVWDASITRATHNTFGLPLGTRYYPLGNSSYFRLQVFNRKSYKRLDAAYRAACTYRPQKKKVY